MKLTAHERGCDQSTGTGLCTCGYAEQQQSKPPAKKDRCFLIPANDGLGFIRVRAEKKPTGKTLKALQDLFGAAYRKMESEQKSKRRKRATK